MSISLQPFKWLNIHSCYGFGNAIYYDAVDPFLGNRTQLHANFTLQPTKSLNLFSRTRHQPLPSPRNG